MNELPIHFFTIVLNGKPFIPYHIEIFKQLEIPWHWHIIEGVAELKNDTSWCLENGGSISENIHSNGLSIDGTSQYLEEIEKKYPKKISIYRKPENCFWEGKCEMVNAPLEFINEEALLWQIDSDELWTKDQIEKMYQMYIDNPDKTAGYFWCHYFVAPSLVISTRNCYAQNPKVEWLRTFRYTPGSKWHAHEPPILKNSSNLDISKINPFTHLETEKEGLIFQHYSYTTKEQLQFKEKYYGYTGAYNSWLKLQEEKSFPILLRDHFEWIKDSALAEPANKLGISPIASINSEGNWIFAIDYKNRSESARLDKALENKNNLDKNNNIRPIVIDCVFFQLAQTGIARMWENILSEWSKTEFAEKLILLDRENTAPKYRNIKSITINKYIENNIQKEKEYLELICKEINPSLFISTYYTSTFSFPSLQFVYDMIPEICNFDLNENCWKEKKEAFLSATQFVSISENTKKDLHKFYPEIKNEKSNVCLLAAEDKVFYPATSKEIVSFHNKYNITKPYFILVAPNRSYKNGTMIFEAFQRLTSQFGFSVVIIGGKLSKEDVEKFPTGLEIININASDEELRIAYSGAISLVYPSSYEGFGLPILEAMSCQCPVITTPFSSIPEVAKDAVLYINNVEELSEALCEIQKPSIQYKLISAGVKQAQKFSWKTTANKLKEYVLRAIDNQQKSGEDQHVNHRYY